MLNYSRSLPLRTVRCALLWVNALFPFLWPVRHLVKRFHYIRGIALYVRDYRQYARLNRDDRFPIRFVNGFPCLFDRFDAAGVKPRHYFHQDLWAAKKVFSSGVPVHFDLGSRIDGFVAHCAVFCRIRVVDIRALQPLDTNIEFVQGSITKLDMIASGSVQSLSSLHVFEHIGLGRYGDPLGAEQLELAIGEVRRVLAPGGDFYFAVPVGMQRLEFNAQRIFAVSTVLKMFEGLELRELSGIDDDDNLTLNIQVNAFDDSAYSCGLFHFQKPIS